MEHGKKKVGNGPYEKALEAMRPKPTYADIVELRDEIERLKDDIGAVKSPFNQPVTLGLLSYEPNDGIYFKGKALKLRAQTRMLCALFMVRHQKRIEYGEILENIVSSHKRAGAEKNIPKYVSELHDVLKKKFHKPVIFNEKKEAYIFDIERDS